MSFGYEQEIKIEVKSGGSISIDCAQSQIFVISIQM